MFSFLKKSPTEAKSNPATILSLSKHIATNAILSCKENYELLSSLNNVEHQVILDSDVVMEGSYYFWIYNLSTFYRILYKSKKDYGDKDLESFIEPIFSKIYIQSKSYFIQYVKEETGTNYFKFIMPIDDVNLDLVTNLIVLPLASEDGKFDKFSSIGFTFSNFFRVIGLNVFDVEVRARILNIQLKAIERGFPVYTGAIKMMRESVA